MTANPLRKALPESDRVHPPQGGGEAERADRVRFWIEHGNRQLAINGRADLQWRHSNGHYFIEPR